MSDPASTRSSLLRRVRDPADTAAWAEFVALYRPLLVAYVRGRGLNEEDVADVVQDVFARLIPALAGFELDPARGRFRTWLWRVTTNAVFDRGRRSGRRVKAERGWFARRQTDAPAAEPDPGWASAYRDRVLAFALDRVRESVRPTTWLCFDQHLIRGRPAAEVAAELGLTANVVYVNASRVLARLRARCREHMEGLGDETAGLPG